MGGIQDGGTPVFIAAQNGYKECIEVLARLGGDVNKAMAVSVHGVVWVVVGAHRGVSSMELCMWCGMVTWRV